MLGQSANQNQSRASHKIFVSSSCHNTFAQRDKTDKTDKKNSKTDRNNIVVVMIMKMTNYWDD